MASSLPDELNLSLADFYLADSPSPLTPPSGFSEWRRDASWAASLFERSLLGAPEPRTHVEVEGSPHPIINLSSYNYLGLARHPRVLAAAEAALHSYGAGACGSPILSGMTDLHRQLEDRLSRFLKRESSMLFTSGYGGALGAISSLLREGDVAILDEKAHMSLVDGARLARARIRTFTHNDPEALGAVLERGRGQRQLVVVEGIYSVDGDYANLPGLLDVAEAYGAPLFVDEAHSMLTAGANGRGVSEYWAVEERVGLYYGTFSKAFAGVGGFVSGEGQTLDYMRYYADSYVFSCALPPSVVAGLIAALDVAATDNGLRLRLQENADYFREGLHRIGLNPGASSSQVIPIIIGANRRLLYELGHQLLERGLYLAAADYPSVPADQVRFRTSITAVHTRADLDEALNILEDVAAPRLRDST
jgi:glycine C-acetyltransferase